MTVTSAPSSSPRLSRTGRYGPVALVTGASDGIGREFARALGAKKFDLVLVARRTDRLQALADELTSQNDINVTIIAANLGEAAEVARVIKATETLDIGMLVASAGFGSAGSFVDLPVENDLNIVDVNCRAVVDLSSAFAARFKKRNGGALILFGSLVGFQGVSYTSTYAATKAFVQSFAEGLRGELKPFGIDVLAVAPGPVTTGFGPRSGMKLTLAAKPDMVARVSLAALGRSTTIIPGWLAKLIAWSLLPLPRWGKTLAMSLVMKRMSH